MEAAALPSHTSSRSAVYQAMSADLIQTIQANKFVRQLRRKTRLIRSQGTRSGKKDQKRREMTTQQVSLEACLEVANKMMQTAILDINLNKNQM